MSRTDQDLLTTQDAALLCGVTRRTMLRWVEAGVVSGHQTPGGRWRIRRFDLNHFMHTQGMTSSRDEGAEAPRLAIVDDDPAHVDAIRRWIEEALPGAEVRVAYDGFSAGLLLRDHLPHVLLLDVLMPGIDGFEVCDRIRSDARFDGVAVFAVSNDMTPERAARLAELGADRCIAKAELLPSLENTVRLMADGRRDLR